MKAFAVGLSGAVLLALAAGCQPQLAEVELGDAEVQWNAIGQRKLSGGSARPAPPRRRSRTRIPRWQSVVSGCGAAGVSRR